jgi:hypothetical protein
VEVCAGYGRGTTASVDVGSSSESVVDRPPTLSFRWALDDDAVNTGGVEGMQGGIEAAGVDDWS